MSALNKDMEEVESMRKQLAEFFCEDPVSFKLEECFKVRFNNWYNTLKNLLEIRVEKNIKSSTYLYHLKVTTNNVVHNAHKIKALRRII